MLRVLALYLDARHFLAGRRRQQDHAVVVLDGHGQLLAIGRKADPFGRLADRDAAGQLAGDGIDDQQLASLAIGQVEMPRPTGNAARPLADASRRRSGRRIMMLCPTFVGEIGQRHGQAGRRRREQRSGAVGQALGYLG